MRRYHEPVEVRRGLVAGSGATSVEGPEQFLWRGRLWKVRSVLARWVETGAWWHSPSVSAALGTDEGIGEGTGEGISGGIGGGTLRTTPLPGAVGLLAERELWRVQAGVGRSHESGDLGVFELSFDVSDGAWELVGCED